MVFSVRKRRTANCRRANVLYVLRRKKAENEKNEHICSPLQKESELRNQKTMKLASYRVWRKEGVEGRQRA